MKNLAISRAAFSELFWQSIFISEFPILKEVEERIRVKHEHFESLRNSAEYNTGSVSLSAAVCIALVASYFQPKIVGEVGTFIGRSTFSITIGAELGGKSLDQIHTCDVSNNIRLDALDGTILFQYPKQTSSQMFNQMKVKGVAPDFYLLDGRISGDDLKVMRALGADGSIILLDDFEGTEKGVVNAHLLTQEFKDKYLLAYPPQPTLLERYGFMDRCTVGALVPISRVRYVNQT